MAREPKRCVSRETAKCCVHFIGTLHGEHGPYAPVAAVRQRAVYRCCFCGELTGLDGSVIPADAQVVGMVA